LLAYQQRQQKRRNRVITPNMLKSRPVEIKQNVVMRSKHKGSTGSVTSDTSYRSDMTEKATNLKARIRKKPLEIERLDTLESKETFESLKNDAENKMVLANIMLAEATEAKRKAQLEIAEEKERAKVADDERKNAQKDEEELQKLVKAQAAEERKRYEAIEKKLAAEAEEKCKAHAEAIERIAMLEADQKRLDQEHKAALAEAQKQAKIAAEEEKRRQDLEKQRLQLEEQLRISALKDEEKRQTLEAEGKRNAQEEAEERIRLMESEQKRLDQEHKAALAEAQKQAKIAADEEKRRLEVEQHKQVLEEQLRLEVKRQAEIAAATKKRFFKISAAEAEEKTKAQAEAVERIGMLEATHKRLDKEHKVTLAEAQRLAKVAADEEKSRREVEQQKLKLEEKLRIEIERHAMIASSENKWRLKAAETRKKLEEEAHRQAQIAADEGKKRLEADGRRLQLEEEAQKQAQIAVDEGKKRLEAEQMRLQLEVRLLEEKEKRAAAEESSKWFDIKRLYIGRQAAEAAKLKSPAAKKEADTQSYSGFFVSEGVSNCTTEEKGDDIIRSNSTLKEAVEVEMPSIQESNKLDTIEDSWTRPGDKSVTLDKPSKLIGSTSFDVGKLTVRHEVKRGTPSVYSISSSSSAKSQPLTKSLGLKSLWPKNKDTEQEAKSEGPKTKRIDPKQADGNAKSSGSTHDGSTSGTSELVSVTLRDLAAEKGSDLSTVENEDLKLLDQACVQVEKKIEDTITELSQASQEEEEEHAEGKVEEKSSKKPRTFLKSVRKDKAKEGNDTDNVHNSMSRLQQLELDLLELCKEIALKKVEAERLLTESTSASKSASKSESKSVSTCESKSESSYKLAIERGAGMARKEKDVVENFGTIHENEEFKGNETSGEYQMEESIEVMPTLSDTEVISVNTPVSIDESAFAQKPNLLHSGSHIKRKPLKMSKDEKRMVRNTKANADDQFQVENGGASVAVVSEEVFLDGRNVRNEDTIVSNGPPNNTFADYDDPMYDEEIAALVANSNVEMAYEEYEEANDAMAYEEEDVDEFVEEASPPDTYIEIPARRTPVRRVRSKEMASQTDDYPMTSPRMISPRMEPRVVMSPRVKSPRPSLPPKRESFLERAAFFGTRACTGGRQTVFACADPCNEKKQQDFNEIDGIRMEMNYYDPNPPAARSILRNGKPSHPQDEEDLVTRAYEDALQRAEAMHLAEREQNAREDNEVREQHSARRQPRKHPKKKIRYDDIMSVDGRYVHASKHAKERKDREQVPRKLEIMPRAQTPRGGRQQVWREDVASPREDRWRADVASPREDRWVADVASPREDRWGADVASPREDMSREDVASTAVVAPWLRSPREDEAYRAWKEELSCPKEKKGLGKKMLKGMKKLAKARIVYGD